MGNQITAENAFIVIAMFSVLQNSIKTLPYTVSGLMSIKASLKRINDFLNLEEI
jgi:hypothetical protein